MKNRQISHCAIRVLLLVFLWPTHCAFGQQDSAGRSVDSPREALEVALEYTGFAEIEGLLEAEHYDNVQVIKLEDSTIPWLVEQVYNKPAWEIYLDSVHLSWPWVNADYVNDHNPKRFHILIDSTRGVFVKAYTKYEGEFDPYLGVELNAARAEHYYSANNAGPFLSFCQAPPPVNMFDALGQAAPSDPIGAKELSVLLVRQKHKGEEKSLWQILARGFPPRRLITVDTIPPWNNRGRTVVDAETGQALFFTVNP